MTGSADNNEAIRGAETAASTNKPAMDRRDLVKSLGKAALLPALVGVFVASNAHDAAAS